MALAPSLANVGDFRSPFDDRRILRGHILTFPQKHGVGEETIGIAPPFGLLHRSLIGQKEGDGGKKTANAPCAASLIAYWVFFPFR